MRPSLVAISFAAHVDPTERDVLLRRADAALSLRTGRSVQRTIDHARLVVLSDPSSAHDAYPLPLCLTDDEAGGRLLPPAGRVEIDDARMRIRTDLAGLKHLYVRRSNGWIAVSTSALVLGALAASPIDPDAWGAAAVVGFLDEDRTVFREVKRLPAAHVVTVEEGALSFREDAGGEPPPEPAPTMLKSVVERHLASHPEAGIELSGGLDSRVLLAAIPPADRRGRSALTIGEPDDPDVLIAARIAERYDLDHHIVAPDISSGADPGATFDAVVAAGRHREHAADALAAHVLDEVERLAPPGARFTGVNGEFVRGFYYPGTPRRGPVTTRRVERLARWRLFTNHAAATWLFDAAWLAQQQRRIIDATAARLTQLSPTWRAATDEYYLAERIPTWAGPGYSHSSTRRPVLAPFLDPRFIAWARRTPTRLRADSRALAGLLGALDPDLAAMPLDTGLIPDRHARGGVGADLARARRFATKAAHKIEQRRRGSRRPPRGAAALVGPMARALQGLDLSRELEGVDFLAPDAIERITSGASSVDQPTASYLANLVGTRRFVRSVERHVTSPPGRGR